MCLLSDDVDKSEKYTKYSVLFFIYITFFLDNVLLTVVVPIIPDYLHTNSAKFLNQSPLFTNIQESLPAHPYKNSTENYHGNISPYTKNDSKLSTENSEIEKENGPIGLLLSSKALVQIILNPVVGYWTYRVGFRVPIFFGGVNLLLASILFAYGDSFLSMLAARAIQGVSSACIGVAGMCLLADIFRDQRERSRAMGIVLGSVALGVLIGYPFGGFLYEFVNKEAPFIVIAVLVFVNLVMQLFFLDFTWTSQMELAEDVDWHSLLRDPVILISTGAIFVSTCAMSVLEPCLPIWLMTHMKPEKWQLGTVFIPDSLGYLLSTNFFGVITYKLGQWRVSIFAIFIVGLSAIADMDWCVKFDPVFETVFISGLISLFAEMLHNQQYQIMIPTAKSLNQLLLPHFTLGLSIGAIDVSLVPLLADMVDVRHGPVYGAVFSLQQTSVSLAYFVAPLLGGEMAHVIGFEWTMRVIGIANITYSGLLIWLAQKYSGPLQFQNRRLSESSNENNNELNSMNVISYNTIIEN